jgi:hypothetical protein
MLINYNGIVFNPKNGVILHGCDCTAKAIILQDLKGVTALAIGDRAFRNFRKLESIALPDTIESIGCQAFQGCTSLTSVRLPVHIKRLIATFEDCKALRSIEFSEGISIIGCYSFYGTALESISIPEGVQCIGTAAFYGCDSLTEVTLPKSLRKIEHHAFDITNDKLVLYVAEGSYGEKYAKRKGFNYRVYAGEALSREKSAQKKQ